MFAYLLGLLSLLTPTGLARAEPSPVEDIDFAAIAAQPAWTKLLMYMERGIGAARSPVQGELFFLAANGATDPLAELLATRQAFLQPLSAVSEPDYHPQCRFPARYYWLATQRGGLPPGMPQVTCNKYEQWRSQVATDRVSLVFSSYFSGNPSSLFGHTFLLLHHSGTTKPQPLLDQTISFLGVPNTDVSILYGWRGLTGGFPGRMQMVPYYLKVQEYNNSDSRDLWEYELNLAPAELELLLRFLWEMGPQPIPYYYFDQNCSAVLLMLLAAVKPELALGPTHPWVIPSDTIRSVTRQPNLVRQVRYRPSILSQFLRRYRQLDAEQQDVVDDIVGSNAPDHVRAKIKQLAPERRAGVADACLDWIDFRERIAGTKAPEIYARLRQVLLVERVVLPVQAARVEAAPMEERPDLAPPSARIGIAPGYDTTVGSFVQGEWYPALHDLPAAQDRGFPPGLAIGFFGLKVRGGPHDQLHLQRFDLFNVMAVPGLEAVVASPSWGLDISSEALPGCSTNAIGCYEHRIRGGRGLSTRWGKAIGYALAGGQAGVSGQRGVGYFIGPYLTAGLIMPMAEHWKISIEGARSRQFGPGGFALDQDRGEVVAAWRVAEDVEVRLGGIWRKATREGSLSLSRYY